MTDYDAILFDNDGVLVEPPTDDNLLDAALSAFRAVGVDDPDTTHVEEIIRGVTPDSLRNVCSAYDVDPQEFWHVRDTHASEAQLTEFREGGRTQYDDVAAIEDLAHDLGIVSSNQHRTIEFILDFHEFGDRFDTYYGRGMGVEDLDRKKPDPHFLDRALDDLGAESALFVGDSESDVVAAHRAGLDSAFIRRSHCADATLSTDPDYEVENLYDVVTIAN